MRVSFFAGLAAMLVALPATFAEDKKDGKATDRKEKYAEIKLEYSKQQKEFSDAARAAKTQAEYQEALKKRPKVEELLPKILDLVMDNPKDDLSFEMLSFSVQVGGPAAKKQIKLLTDAHATNPKIEAVVKLLMLRAFPEAKPLFEKVLADNSDKSAKAFSAYALANLAFGQGDDEDLTDAKRKEVLKEAEKYFNQIIKDFSEVEMPGRRKMTMGDTAKRFLFDIQHLQIGMTVPEATCENLDGKKEKIADYKGKVVVLDIWATWCGPCVAMIPHEREMVKKLEDKPFALISISADAKKETLENFLKKQEMPWKHWWVGNEDGFTLDWNIRFFPTIYVIDSKGVIRHKNIRGKVLETAVEKLLEEVEKK